MSRTITQNKSISLLLVKNNIMGNQRCALCRRIVLAGWKIDYSNSTHPQGAYTISVARIFAPEGKQQQQMEISGAGPMLTMTGCE